MNRLFNIPSRREKTKAEINHIIQKAYKTNPKRTNTRPLSVNTRKGGIGYKTIEQMRQAFKGYKQDGIRNIMKEDIQILNDYVKAATSDTYIAIDTETTGLNPVEDNIAGVGVYMEGQDALYIPVNHLDYITGTKIKGQLTPEQAKKFLEALDNKGVKWVMHNAKFDMRVLRWQLGVDIEAYWDTALAQRLLNENERAGLNYLWNRYCRKTKEQPKALTFGELIGDGNFIFVPLDLAYRYGAFDPKMTMDVFRFQEPFLTPSHQYCKLKDLEGVSYAFRNIEMPLIKVVADMEDEGVFLDVDYAYELTEYYEKEMEKSNEIIQSIFKEEVLKSKKSGRWDKIPAEKRAVIKSPLNINSWQQLSILIYDIMGMTNPLAKNEEEKRKGTGAGILKALNHPLTENILQYRTFSKLVGTYTSKMPKEISKRTGKVHANFNQYGADTGRFSSDNPNLQNIPSRNDAIRKMFIADPSVATYLKTGNVEDIKRVFVSGDFSQQEPRTLAFKSGDENLIKAYQDNKDIYATVGSIVYGIPYEQCLEFDEDGNFNPEGEKRRNNMKGIVLGIMYGRGSASIADQLGITTQEANEIINRFFEGFPKVKQWIDSVHTFAKQNAYVKTVYGRKRRLPDIQLPKYEIKHRQGREVPENVKRGYFEKLDKAWFEEKREIIQDAAKYGYIIKDNTGFIAEAERQSVNSIIQGTSADITKKAMLDIANNKRLKELGFRMVLTIHDEVIGTCPIENYKEAAEELSRTMIAAPTDRISVPMKVDAEATIRWAGEDVKDVLSKGVDQDE